jgi:hypothetical protein
MSVSSIYRQLVLFDCDDGRLSLFKDHKIYLPRLPSNCECYVFWNDLKLPVYKKLNFILSKYSHIHPRPSYCQHMDNSSNSDLLSLLDKLICKFSFVLLVHSDDQSYMNVFKRVTEQYGNEKLELKAINKPFSHHLPHILTRLRQKCREYNYHEYLKRLSSKKQLAHERRSVFSNSIWNLNMSCIPYDIEQNTNFKRLIKRKQKRLNIDFLNTRLCTPTSFSAQSDVAEEYEQDNDDYLSTAHRVTRYFDGISLKTSISSFNLSSNYFAYIKPMTRGKVFRTKLPINLLNTLFFLFRIQKKRKHPWTLRWRIKPRHHYYDVRSQGYQSKETKASSDGRCEE